MKEESVYLFSRLVPIRNRLNSWGTMSTITIQIQQLSHRVFKVFNLWEPKTEIKERVLPQADNIHYSHTFSVWLSFSSWTAMFFIKVTALRMSLQKQSKQQRGFNFDQWEKGSPFHFKLEKPIIILCFYLSISQKSKFPKQEHWAKTRGGGLSEKYSQRLWNRYRLREPTMRFEAFRRLRLKRTPTPFFLEGDWEEGWSRGLNKILKGEKTRFAEETACRLMLLKGHAVSDNKSR